MQRMNGIDPMFIYSETASTPMEVAYACVFDPSTAPKGYSFDAVRALLTERVPSLPPFRRRLMPVPLGLDHPRWVDDPDFDLDNHLHRLSAPEPHGPAEFADMVASIMSRPLCPEQPPWEMYVIEDLADGRVGLVAKVHHSVIDGVAGAALMAQLLDLSAEGRPNNEPCAPWHPPQLPSAAQLLTHALPNMLSSPLRTVRAVREIGRTALRLARCALDGNTGPVSVPLFAPDLLQQPVVGEREVGLAQMDLADIARVRQRFGVTMNDVVMAVCSGALRTHFIELGQPVDESLVAIVPVSVRPASAGADEGENLGNHLSAMFVPLGNDRDTPVERLHWVVESCRAMKGQEREVGYGPLGSALAEAMPPMLAKPVVQGGIRAGILRRLRAGNLMVSNVPGPDFPLYFAGMRMEAVHPMGPVVDGLALNITVQSYEQSMFIGINASAGAVPQLPGLARAMVLELAALVAAAEEGDARSPSRPAVHWLREEAEIRVPKARLVPRHSVPTAHARRARSPVSASRPVPVVRPENSWD
jgi:WS/DGAT/MGAT family acyltransferase